MGPVAPLELTPQQISARIRVAQMKRLGALERLKKARWKFDRTPNESNLAALREWTFVVLQYEHEMCGLTIDLNAEA